MVSPLFLAVWPLLLSRAGPPLHMSAVNQGTQPAQRFFLDEAFRPAILRRGTPSWHIREIRER